MRTITFPRNFKEWRTMTRALLAQETPPHDVLWQSPDQGSLFHEEPPLTTTPSKTNVPKAFLKLAETVACHRSNEQWSLLYSLLWRLTRGERHLLSMAHDPEVSRVQAMAKHIRRDIHKMHAFVRFRKVGETNEREQFIAWFEPDHRIVRLTAPFFRKRFAAMDWSILTPDECVHWDGSKIHFSEGVDPSLAPGHDELDDLWRTYYRSIFNPARLKTRAMQAEMPRKYWKNLPEADLIPELIASSERQTEEMISRPTSPVKPAPKNAYLEQLKELEKNPETNPGLQS
ncbi:MAG: TIGR03915 family putative DNA repair protein [Akkermansiaceae bacterium]